MQLSCSVVQVITLFLLSYACLNIPFSVHVMRYALLFQFEQTTDVFHSLSQTMLSR